MVEILKVVKIDETYISIDCSEDVMRFLYEYFSFEVPGAKWNPKVKAGIWDGYIRLFQMYNAGLYIGLFKRLCDLAEIRGWVVEYDKFDFSHLIPLENAEVDEFVNSLDIRKAGDKISLHPHQKSAIYHCLMDAPRATILSPTASGKSLIIYILIRYFLNIGKKILMIVPYVSLVNQMFTDFADYSSHSSWKAGKDCHLILGGKEKNSDAGLYISTWQSIYEMDKSYFNQFSVIIADEVHTASADSIKGIMEKSANAKYRFGFTGTLSESKTNKMVIEGLFGSVFKVAKTSELIEQGLMAGIDIKVCFLGYSAESRKLALKMKYQSEVEFTVLNEAKLRFTATLADKISGNTMILVNLVEKHAKPLYEYLLTNSEKVVYLIHGGTHAAQREEIRQILETQTDAIVVATYGTMSVGVNIPSLRNIIFGSTFKSKVRVLQSIGRGLRKSEGKTNMTLYDLVDDLTYIGPRGAKKPNYLMKHFFKRLQFYKEEGFRFSVHNKDIE